LTEGGRSGLLQQILRNKYAPMKIEIKTAHDKNILQRQIDTTDKQIDNLVYGLYGLTEKEIRIVEGG
jgi:hypothetical protein